MKEGNMKEIPDKAVICCALTGMVANRKQCPHIPYTPEEMAAEAKRAYEAGCSVVHIHARERDGTATSRWEMYKEAMLAIRDACPIIINFSTGVVGVPMEKRLEHIEGLKPEIGALNMGSMNYAIYSEKKKKFYIDAVFENKFKDIILLLEKMREADVHPECECFDTGHINNVHVLQNMGLFDDVNFHYSFVMGVYGGIPASTQTLANQVGQIPEGSFWQVIGVSLAQWHMVASGLAMGGHVRVGFEDNFYLSPGEMAKSNGELVAKAARMARDIGREPATVEETRQIMGLRSYDDAVAHSNTGSKMQVTS